MKTNYAVNVQFIDSQVVTDDFGFSGTRSPTSSVSGLMCVEVPPQSTKTFTLANATLALLALDAIGELSTITAAGATWTMTGNRLQLFLAADTPGFSSTVVAVNNSVGRTLQIKVTEAA